MTGTVTNTAYISDNKDKDEILAPVQSMCCNAELLKNMALGNKDWLRPVNNVNTKL
jgi:hypothetical protein